MADNQCVNILIAVNLLISAIMFPEESQKLLKRGHQGNILLSILSSVLYTV